MNKKLFLMLTAGLFALLFTSCGDSIVDAENDRAKLNVLVLDANSGQPLSASVKLLSTGSAESTDASTGIASFGEVFSGSHALLVESEGYAKVIIDGIYINGEQTEITLTARLASSGSSLTGHLYYLKDTHLLPAANCDVRVELEDGDYQSFMDKIFEVKVGADGKFVFPELPAVGNKYSLYALECKLGDQTYQTRSLSGSSLNPGSATYITNALTYSNTTTFFTFLGYTSEIQSTGDVVFTFTEDLDKSKIDLVSITVNNSQAAIKEISGKTITLKPAGGKWSSNFSVIFSEDLISVSGESLDMENYFYYSQCPVTIITDVSALAQATNLKVVEWGGGAITASTDDLTLSWDEVEGADGYRVFAKASKGNGALVRIWVGYSTSPNIELFAGNTAYNLLGLSSMPFADGGTIEFIVQAYNNKHETPLTGTGVARITASAAP